MLDIQYNKTILQNGLTIISEKIPSTQAISIGVWIKSGSRQENPKLNGVAHFLEHMLFKGTEKRSARDIAYSLESVGGYLNAFTGKEQTCYFADVLAEQLPKAVDVLSDMLCHSIFSEKEIEKERKIILEEIDSVEDTPDELIQDIFVEKLFLNHSLGYPILGSRQSISHITKDQMIDFYRNNYVSPNIVITVAGHINHQRLVDLCESKFHLPTKCEVTYNKSTQNHGYGRYYLHRPVNQTHICVGTSALPYNHYRRYELLILNTILGSGMGSRLFQNIREKYGIAYSIYSFVDFFTDNGLMAIYLGTDNNTMQKALDLVKKEFDKLLKRPISKKELNRVKSQLKGNLILGFDNISRRMSRLAKMEIYLQTFHDIDHTIEEINKVTQESVFDLVNLLFKDDRMLQVAFLPK